MSKTEEIWDILKNNNSLNEWKYIENLLIC